MAPNSRNKDIQVIELISDSEERQVIEISEDSERHGPPPSKRQKIERLEEPKTKTKIQTKTDTKRRKMTGSNEKNAHLKGRRRFNADLEDMSQLCVSGFALAGFTIQDCQAGEDEGAINVQLCRDMQCYPISFLISDTSDYPKSHAFFASTEATVPSSWTEVLGDVSNGRSAPIEDTIRKLLLDLERVDSKDTSQAMRVDNSDDEYESALDEDDEDGSVEDFGMYDDLDVFDSQPTAHRNIRKAILQSDWNEIYASGYRPGFIGFGGDDFSITTSIPIVSLAEMIPPQALMAWDGCLLSRSQSLCLIICGCRGIYPPLNSDGRYAPGVAAITFKVGLTQKYKPSIEHAREAGRSFRMMGMDAEDEVRRIEKEKKLQERQEEAFRRMQEAEENGEEDVEAEPIVIEEEEEEPEDEGSFNRFSLSSSMESLLDSIFLKVLQLRRQFKLGWAGAEALHLASEKNQLEPALLFHRNAKDFTDADENEAKMQKDYNFPLDPLLGCDKDKEINLPLTAFSYLIRRLMLCTRHCLVCFNPIKTDFQALKPYVCDSKLCSYQYYSLDHGPSLEYEICRNPMGVDLLVSMAFCAAQEGVLDDPLPIGLGIRVRKPTAIIQSLHTVHGMYRNQAAQPEEQPTNPVLDDEGLCHFDDLSKNQMRAAIVELVNQLPPIDTMKRHLDRRVGFGKRKPGLKECDASVSAAAWLVLRWIVASCTAYLEETRPEERVRNIDDTWRQFRLSVGAPDAEGKFQRAIEMAKAKNNNAQKYPSLYAFHGSGMRNWHSILRHGLWYKQVINGRAYGDGVYFAKDPMISMGSYAAGAGSVWKNSKIAPANCAAIAEIVNLPAEFKSHNPYLVVPQTEWIMCRHLLVKCAEAPPRPAEDEETVPLVPLDPAHPIISHRQGSKPGKTGAIQIPQHSYRITTLLATRQSELVEEEHDEEDVAIFNYQEPTSQQVDIVVVEDEKMEVERPADDWQHDLDWVQQACSQLMPPPEEATPSATMALSREFKSMMKEQDSAKSLRDLGWYMPIEFNEDNLFQWIVEMHSFDPDLPIAKDLKAKRVNSVIFEIRFPPAFPNSPPFFRIIKPRFLPFIHGGGGHVTGGGSICMDLLTADGWLPSYSISAVLMQIKLAISNPDPRPARLAPNWDTSYSPGEALEGYKRAAMTHNWKIPAGLDRLVT